MNACLAWRLPPALTTFVKAPRPFCFGQNSASLQLSLYCFPSSYRLTCRPSRFVASETCTSMCKGILIADDSAPARQVVRVVLERAGYAVCAEAVDGLDAVDKASELKPALIVLDLRLPRLNGIEAAYVLRGRLPNTPIILFTMFDISPS